MELLGSPVGGALGGVAGEGVVGENGGCAVDEDAASGGADEAVLDVEAVEAGGGGGGGGGDGEDAGFGLGVEDGWVGFDVAGAGPVGGGGVEAAVEIGVGGEVEKMT